MVNNELKSSLVSTSTLLSRGFAAKTCDCVSNSKSAPANWALPSVLRTLAPWLHARAMGTCWKSRVPLHERRKNEHVSMKITASCLNT